MPCRLSIFLHNYKHQGNYFLMAIPGVFGGWVNDSAQLQKS